MALRVIKLQRHLQSGTVMNANTETVCVLGAGSFGSTMAHVLAQSETIGRVNLWARRASVAAEINEKRTNQQYTGEHKFPLNILATSCLAEALEGASCVCVAIPSAFMAPILGDITTKHRAGMTPDVVFVSLVKSLHRHGSSLTTMCAEMSAILGPGTPVVAMMGPNIYTEMLQDMVLRVYSIPNREILLCHHVHIWQYACNNSLIVVCRGYDWSSSQGFASCIARGCLACPAT